MAATRRPMPASRFQSLAVQAVACRRLAADILSELREFHPDLGEEILAFQGIHDLAQMIEQSLVEKGEELYPDIRFPVTVWPDRYPQGSKDSEEQNAASEENQELFTHAELSADPVSS